MDLKYLNRLLSDDSLISEKIKQYLADKTIKKAPSDKEEIRNLLKKYTEQDFN